MILLTRRELFMAFGTTAIAFAAPKFIATAPAADGSLNVRGPILYSHPRNGLLLVRGEFFLSSAGHLEIREGRHVCMYLDLILNDSVIVDFRRPDIILPAMKQFNIRWQGERPTRCELSAIKVPYGVLQSSIDEKALITRSFTLEPFK